MNNDVMVRVRSGRFPMPAMIRNGLALHRAPLGKPGWTITHAESGYAVLEGLKYHAARRIMTKLLKLNWDSPRRSILSSKSHKALTREVAASIPASAIAMRSNT